MADSNRKDERPAIDDLRTIRTIHHFAGSGGTIISKAIAAQPNVVLISEISPSLGDVRFNPMDPVQQFLAGAVRHNSEKFSLVDVEKVAREVLADRCKWVHKYCIDSGHILVLRDHAHSDFMSASPQDSSQLLLALEESELRVHSIITLRNPIDSYLSSIRNGWTEKISGFDDYCSRLERFVTLVPMNQIFLYEAFCEDPVTVTKAMCIELGLDFNPEFQMYIPKINLTGDSGRKGDTIRMRIRQTYPAEFATEVETSESYARLKARFWLNEPMP